MFKFPQDAIWHASAMEGMATIHLLDAWSAGHGLVRSFVLRCAANHAKKHSHSKPLLAMRENHGLISTKS